MKRLLWFKVLQNFVVLCEVLSAIEEIDCVPCANDKDDPAAFVSLETPTVLAESGFVVGLVKYLVGQYLTSSSQATAIFSQN